MKTLFDADRMTLDEAIQITADSLRAYGASYRVWCIAFSGGKDSTATLAVVVWLIVSGQVPAPDALYVVYADTRQELPPLHESAMAMLAAVRERGFETRVALPEMDRRFFVYMFGRGVPPPTNTFRWCTEGLKIVPMQAPISDIAAATGQRPLLLIGLRLGESAARDRRIAVACGRDGGECGQGWYQQRPPRDAADTLAPILHWRTCHVWDFLQTRRADHAFDCRTVAEVYDQDIEGSPIEIAARTGCIGCPLASQDFSLQRILRKPQWAHLMPLRRLKALYEELRQHHHRIRKGNDERRKDGSPVVNPGRIGPLTMAAREYGLATVLGVQAEVNTLAAAVGRVGISLINAEEEARIRELIAANTWPNKWTGDELPGNAEVPQLYADGTIQRSMFGE